MDLALPATQLAGGNAVALRAADSVRLQPGLSSPTVSPSARPCEGAGDHRRRILALCLGGMGDTVLAFAALHDLRRACPDDHISALAMWPQSAELLEDLGIFDEVWQHNFQLERCWRSLWTALKLRVRHFDVSILAFPTNRFEYNALSYLLGARRRLGHTYVRGGDLLSLRFLLTERIDQQPGRHVVDENRALVAHLAGATPQEPADNRLGPLAPKYHHYAARMLAHLREPLLGIHAGSSAYKGLAAKRWPAKCFGLLCRRAHRELGLQPVVFGAPDENDLKLQIQQVCPEVHFAHGPTIRHTAALIARCAVMASNDSGLAHIASALDVPVVMACGPTGSGEVGPYGRPDRALVAGLKCAPCFQVGRRPMCCTHEEYSACMKQIAVEQMLAAVGSCLRQPAAAANQRDTSTSPETLTGKSSPMVSTSAPTGVGP
jgi:ADP-heptose:LPS heptosyltransferase